MTTLEFIKMKHYENTIKRANNRKAVLKQQITKINEKPTERKVKPHHVWNSFAASFLGGAVAGAVVAATNEASVGGMALGAFIGGETGLVTSLCGSAIYACKPFSNAFNKFSKQHKTKSIKKQDEKIANASQKLEELER